MISLCFYTNRMGVIMLQVVWSVSTRQQLAHCVGHASWVSGACFLPAQMQPPPGAVDTEYEIASVAWDGTLCIWSLTCPVSRT